MSSSVSVSSAPASFWCRCSGCFLFSDSLIPPDDFAFAAFEAFLYFPSITVSSIGSILSIAFFNYFGLTITKILSATARSTIDACRTISVWIVGLIIGWEVWVASFFSFFPPVLASFFYSGIFNSCTICSLIISFTKESWLQVGGFIVLVLGTFTYNQVNYSSIN